VIDLSIYEELRDLSIPYGICEVCLSVFFTEDRKVKCPTCGSDFVQKFNCVGNEESILLAIAPPSIILRYSYEENRFWLYDFKDITTWEYVNCSILELHRVIIDLSLRYGFNFSLHKDVRAVIDKHLKERGNLSGR